LSVIAVGAVFSFLNLRFLSLASLAGIISIGAELGIVAVGTALLLIAGEFDLSTGSNLCLCECVMAILIVRQIHPVVAFVVILMLGSMVGFANGVITLKGNIPSLVTTLGMMFFLRGAALYVTEGFPITARGGFLFSLLNSKFYEDFRSSAFWFIASIIILSILVARTRFGNWVLCTGGNVNVSRALGIKTDRVKIISFMISGFTAALGAAVELARFSIATAATGANTSLEAIASAVMGGVALTGGSGTILGAAIGAFLLGMVRLGMITAGAPAFWYTALVGLMLIAATVMNANVFAKKRET
jgi:simple sugar transport system permease protein